MAKKHPDRLDAVGWRFFAIAFGVALPPAMIAAFKVTVDDVIVFVPVGMGLLMAALAAALLSWGVNSAVQFRARRRRAAARKAGKKT
ncbi:MAG: hypothetical protein JXR94_24180 [Candidatus Hydrogenedentes bacterium]|nr:hypothetical protein [Candidatus Hydrogenedentota bacterium]